MSSMKVHHLQKWKTKQNKKKNMGRTTICQLCILTPSPSSPSVHLSTRAPEAGFLVGSGVDNTEHVSPDKRQEVLQRAEGLTGMAVMGATEGGVKCHILTVVQHPDKQFPVFHL